MDISAVRRAIAEAATAAGEQLTCLGYVPDSIPEPCFYAGEVTFNRDLTFARDTDLRVTCRLLVSRADDQAGQQALDDYLMPVWNAVEGAPGVAQTLGGLVDDVVIERVQGYRLYTVGDVQYYGAEFVVRVIE